MPLFTVTVDVATDRPERVADLAVSLFDGLGPVALAQPNLTEAGEAVVSITATITAADMPSAGVAFCHRLRGVREGHAPLALVIEPTAVRDARERAA